ncbi:hypothetical protein M422DRAFT_253406 [Sphaerobolus stellatus SS14]|uniref:Uncharacterized protein n=1 Tax=Sphaerobolus stellatus (strain SS14) TaxID=990650 RepID=A0A0C9VMT9_SPHS4|nr:hypothetical protein M422DRAFT_253406 [Sphaerobolus stellatus SS14]
MAGTTDTSGYPGPPPDDNFRGEDDGSDRGNQSLHPSCNNSPRRSTGGGGGGLPDGGDNGDNGDGGPPADPPPDGNDPINFADDKVGYTLTFLKGTALEFFEPYILAEDNPGYVEPTFFTHWIVFKQILLDNFGSTLPEEEAEMALEKLAFPDSSRATK